MRRTALLALLLLVSTSVFAADDVIRKGFPVADGAVNVDGQVVRTFRA